MNKINRITFLTTFLILAYLLSACSGVPAGVKVDDSSSNSQSQAGQVSEVVFTGTVEAINGNQVTVSGQVITVDSAVLAAANVVVGDNIKVEAQVGQDGSVTAVSIELSGSDDNANSNDNNQNDSNANDNASNSNDNQNGNSNDNSNADSQQEVTGTVETITTDSITIDGVVYMIADFTEFKDLIAMGDQVKIHVIVNADGTLTIGEIEKSVGTGLDNGNSNSNGSDDNSNLNSNSNSDDHGGNSNGSDDNSNDDHGNDNSNDSNGNGNGNG
jgi:hypothetical protein